VAVSEPVFDYVRRFMEIAFVVVLLFAVVRIFSGFARTGSGMNYWVITQNQQLVTNMQRVFADTVSGICILPSISDTISDFKKELSASNSAVASSQRLLYLMWV
jgi:hypothetical protein